MKKLIPLAAAAVLGLAVVGCDHNRSDTSADGARPMQAQAAADKTAVANIRPAEQASTQPSMGKATGTVTFTQVGDDKVKVVIDLQGLPPGKHGFHIHEKGDLSAADLSSAGGHFNPGHHHHAGPDSPKRHAGDLGNIKADANGEVKKEMTIGGISVGTGAANDIVGKSVIVHGKADDLKTDPAGNAGPRIAGGVIEEQK
jgi:Cu-Zn family superoxide dismutase